MTSHLVKRNSPFFVFKVTIQTGYIMNFCAGLTWVEVSGAIIILLSINVYHYIVTFKTGVTEH